MMGFFVWCVLFCMSVAFCAYVVLLQKTEYFGSSSIVLLKQRRRCATIINDELGVGRAWSARE